MTATLVEILDFVIATIKAGIFNAVGLDEDRRRHNWAHPKSVHAWRMEEKVFWEQTRQSEQHLSVTASNCNCP